MRTFFIMLFASLLSFIVFSLILVFLLIAFVSRLIAKEKPEVADKSVLVLDLSQHFNERKQTKPLSSLSDEGDDPGLFDVIRLINHAKSDNNISGIYIESDGNANGFASSHELRNAMLE